MHRRLTWLHLSDLHLRAGDQYDQKATLTSLLEDLVALVDNQSLSFDLVFVTGDIAYSGRREEYAVAASFFRDLSSATSVPMARLFCVPGNHDVDRSLLTPFLEKSARSLNSRELVSQVIGNPRERALFTERLRPYREFLIGNFSWAGESDASDLSYSANVEIHGIRVGVLGLNSAWLAGSDSDRGNLVIGERQVRDALSHVSKADFVVSLIHHPPSWLADFDSSDVRGLVDGRCDFLLHGHVHELGVVNVVSPDSEVFHLAAGATYQGRREILSYNFVSVDLDTGTAQVSMRRYSDRAGGFWAADTGMYKAAPNGVLNLTLPERLSRKAQTTDLTALNQRLATLVSETVQPSGPREPMPAVPRPPPALIKEIRAGRCLLFAGAGASMDAKLPSWLELLDGMVQRSDDAGALSESEHAELGQLLHDGEYMVVAAFCRDKLGKYEFAEYLRERLSDNARSSRTHRILSAIPFRAATTTNFDPFIEHSRERSQVVLPDLMDRLGAAGVESLLNDKSGFPVIKMHGSALDVESIVLTRGDFRRVLFERPKYREFLKRLFVDSTIFFCGYSFRDPNVDFVLQDLVAAYAGNARPHYALLPKPGAIATRYWFEDFNIRVIPYELWEGSHVVAAAFLEELSRQCADASR